MRTLSNWLIVILVPVLASCSSLNGTIRKSDNSAPAKDKPAEVQKADKEIAPFDEDGAFHIVGRGETLQHICSVYGLDLKKVAKVNELPAPFTLKMGDTIFLPADALVGSTDWASAAANSKGGASPPLGKDKEGSVRNIAGAIRGRMHPSVPKLKFPVPSGVLTSPFGHRWGVFHKGLDIAAPIGRAVLACADGQVLFTGRREKFGRYGRIVLLDHGKGVYTQYAHLDTINVKKGQKVKRGQRIAAVGNTGQSTGPHLHLEVRVKNQLYNPLAYFSGSELKGMHVAKRFTDSPMGPVKARWDIPELLTANR